VSGDWRHSHNAYRSGCDRLLPVSATDRLVSDVQFQPGPLGGFYYPREGSPGSLASLVDAGGDRAEALGLAHYTCQAEQTKEGATPVDIGFHYVAADSQGQARDGDGDGIADYAEDINGNGAADPGEPDWTIYNSGQGLSGAPAVQVYTPLK
jgi:hypothetical protein